MNKIKLSEFDLSLLRKIEDIHSFLLEFKPEKSGMDFLEELPSYLAKTLGIDYVQIARLDKDGQSAKTIIAFNDGKFDNNDVIYLKDGPYGKTIEEKVCCISEGVFGLYPNDPISRRLKAEGFAGITLIGINGQPIGLLSVYSRQILSGNIFTVTVLKIVSFRVAIEIEKMLMEIESRRKDERLQVIIKSSIDGFLIMDCSGRFLEVNDTYCLMCGYTVEELLNMNISDIESLETVSETKSHIQKVMILGEDRFESTHRRKDGTVLNVEIGARYDAVEGGRLVAFLHDITDRKEAEKLLQQSEYFFRETQQAAFIGSYKVDFVGNRWESSMVLDQIFGIGKDYTRDLDGWLGLVHPLDKDCMTQYLLNDVVSKGGAFNREYRILRHSDSELRWVHGLGKVGMDENNQVVSLLGTIQDITKRKLTETKLKESNDKFKNLVQNMPVGVLLQGPQTEIILSNHKALELLGLTEDQILGKTSFDPDWGVIHEDGSDFPGSTHPVSQAIASRRPVRNVVMGVYRPIPGDRVWLQVDAEPQFDEEKKVSQVICTFINITKRKKAEQSLNQLNEKLENIVKERTNDLVNLNAELQVAQEKYRTVADFTNDWETWLGTDGNYIYVSPYCMMVTGYSAEEFINDSGLFLRIVHPDDRDLITIHHGEEMTGEISSCSMDFRIIHKLGEERWIGHRCQAVFDSEGNWIGQRGSNTDITERKNGEWAMIASQKQLRALSQKMEAIAEEERIRIAREIHDELGHLLTALKYDIESITEKTDFTPDSFKTEMEPILSMVDALIDSVRKIASELRPGILDHLGLFPAIEWQISQFQMRTRIKCHYELDADVIFDKYETTIIYRILQEILTNVARHSKAENLRISLVRWGALFCMNVMDDGIGFELNNDFYGNSFGLMGMRERAMSIGGELEIESVIGQGTTVTLSLILSQWT
jgi:PAS domain S-box-containing protein